MTLLESLATCPHVVGAKQTRRVLMAGTAKSLLLARDAAESITAPLAAMAAEKSIPTEWTTMRALGTACGISVGAATAAQTI